MHHLTFDFSDSTEGITTIEAMASTPSDRHGAVKAEVQQLLDWAWQRFPDSHGPADEGMDWDDDVQVLVEEGGWHTMILTIAASPVFAEAFCAAFHPSLF